MKLEQFKNLLCNCESRMTIKEQIHSNDDKMVRINYECDNCENTRLVLINNFEKTFDDYLKDSEGNTLKHESGVVE